MHVTGGFGVGAAEQGDELVTAIASHDGVQRSARPDEVRGETLDEAVTGEVALLVVHRLQPVEVEDHERAGCAIRLGMLQLARDGPPEPPPVEESGELVGVGDTMGVVDEPTDHEQEDERGGVDGEPLAKVRSEVAREDRADACADGGSRVGDDAPVGEEERGVEGRDKHPAAGLGLSRPGRGDGHDDGRIGGEEQ